MMMMMMMPIGGQGSDIGNSREDRHAKVSTRQVLLQDSNSKAHD